jgi:hypothetical protein
MPGQILGLLAQAAVFQCFQQLALARIEIHARVGVGGAVQSLI